MTCATPCTTPPTRSWDGCPRHWDQHPLAPASLDRRGRLEARACRSLRRSGSADRRVREHRTDGRSASTGRGSRSPRSMATGRPGRPMPSRSSRCWLMVSLARRVEPSTSALSRRWGIGSSDFIPARIISRRRRASREAISVRVCCISRRTFALLMCGSPHLTDLRTLPVCSDVRLRMIKVRVESAPPGSALCQTFDNRRSAPVPTSGGVTRLVQSPGSRQMWALEVRASDEWTPRERAGARVPSWCRSYEVGCPRVRDAWSGRGGGSQRTLVARTFQPLTS